MLLSRTVRGDDVAKGSSANDQTQLSDIKNFQNDNPGVVVFWGSNNYWNDHFGLVLFCNEAMNDSNRYAVNIPTGDNQNLALNNQYKRNTGYTCAGPFVCFAGIW